MVVISITGVTWARVRNANLGPFPTLNQKLRGEGFSDVFNQCPREGTFKLEEHCSKIVSKIFFFVRVRLQLLLQWAFVPTMV